MTRAEILAMRPGRELDALVAEKVMGRVGLLINESQSVVVGHRPHEYFETGYTDLKEVPLYSTSIAAAWEVVEKLKERYLVNIVVDGASQYAQFVEFRDDDVLTYLAENGTMPENIAKAALLAVSAERRRG
jgi:hypothetical protein